MKTLRVLGIAALSVAISSSLAFAELVVWDFCGPNNKAEIQTMTTNWDAGVEYSSELSVPYRDAAEPIWVGVRIKNIGPGPLTFLWQKDTGLGAWSVFGNGVGTAFKGTAFGEDLDKAKWYTIPLTPRGSTALFSDSSWGGTMPENVDMTGCTLFKQIQVKGKQAKAHLDLSFWRNGKLHTVRVNVEMQ